ncbi:type II toxin-antitoxin system RelE/ParE family toxin [Ruegeria sp. HKCCD6428]|uniref:type II toxin-antitoxin system RelE/ParE family toxin n=1 Tax=Ruegeria sp. HKCCD6428 TaxID=2683002 RepID=UPI001492B0A6|nr:type II toxin-antitoxin system RelE/ParE family toxin [Ruegeria sp. HKCCD6428]NOC84530.1 system killer suppression protein [Ruegeria sp. HKCCD6428]
MHIEFSSSKLKRQLGSAAAMQKAYGNRAKRLQMRLGVLKSAACLADVPTDPPPRCHPLSGEYDGCYAVDVTGNWRLIFEPVSLSDNNGKSTAINLAEVTAIKILDVVDYH